VWVFTKKYGLVSKLLEKRNKIRYCKVALHIISYYTIKFDIILIAYYIDANNTYREYSIQTFEVLVKAEHDFYREKWQKEKEQN
jgi:hypothetical protein